MASSSADSSRLLMITQVPKDAKVNETLKPLVAVLTLLPMDKLAARIKYLTAEVELLSDAGKKETKHLKGTTVVPWSGQQISGNGEYFTLDFYFDDLRIDKAGTYKFRVNIIRESRDKHNRKEFRTGEVPSAVSTMVKIRK